MKRLACAVACLFALGGCEFDRADEEPLEPLNSCNVASDCTGGAQCMSGLCVAPTSEAEFELALQVTPLPNATTPTPHPILIEHMKLDSSTLPRRIDLPAQIPVAGQIRNDGDTIDAALTFTPVHVLKGIASGTVNVATKRGPGGGGTDYTVQLSSGIDYTLFVRPTDPTLPPWRTTFKATGAPVSVDFKELATFQQTFMLQPPDGRELLVQAFDANNQPISSSAKVEPAGAQLKNKLVAATLVFAGEPLGYRLEIRAEQAYEPMKPAQPAEGIFCDDDTPVYPTYSIASQDLPAENDDGAIEIVLPAPPARVRFEGTIKVCDAGNARLLTELPVALTSDQLLLAPLDDEAGAGEVEHKFTASFEAQTTAQLDAQTDLLTFCVQLMEGHYDVVVTPPTNLSCGVYAENRLIKAPEGSMAASGAQLLLPKSAVLQGTLQTTDRTPLADVTVEAVALGRAGVVERRGDSVAATDQDPKQTNPLLVSYNRSRQVTSASDGKFNVPVDLGSYDVLVKPPASSGFAWQVRHDVGVGSDRTFSSIVYMPSPVMLSGRLAYMGSGEGPLLAGAEVLAFAVIGDKSVPGGDVASERAVQIGKAMAGPDGSFILLLPQTIKPDWEW